MWKASGVQQGKRFTLPLKGEALSPKTLVDTRPGEGLQAGKSATPAVRSQVGFGNGLAISPG